MGLRIPPPFQKDFNRDLLRAGLVMDDPADNASNALIMCTKDLFQRFTIPDPHLGWYGHARCVHIPGTRGHPVLWQRSTLSFRNPLLAGPPDRGRPITSRTARNIS